MRCVCVPVELFAWLRKAGTLVPQPLCLPLSPLLSLSLSQAFFYPTRLAVAFVISVLATVTFCVLTIDIVKSIRDSIRSADSAAIRTIFTGLTSVQNLFYSTTNQEVGRLGQGRPG
jgi:hypothetical protein